MACVNWMRPCWPISTTTITMLRTASVSSMKSSWIGRIQSYSDYYLGWTRMTASNSLSTKSQPRWATRIGPSTTFDLLLLCLTITALRGLWICPVSLTLRIICICVCVTGSFLTWRKQNHSCELELADNNVWQFKRGNVRVEGRLACGSYRTAALIVVAIQEAHNEQHLFRRVTGLQTHRVMIWSDSVSAGDFSWLQLHLAFTSPRSLS